MIKSSYLEDFLSQVDQYMSQASGTQSGGSAVQGEDTWRFGSPGDVRKWKNQSAGGGGGSVAGYGSQVTTSERVRTKEAPEMPELPTLELPGVDKRAIRAATQKIAGPKIRTLRQATQQAMGKHYENPNVRKLTLREALQGYGSGLESVMSGAGRQATQEEMAQRQVEADQARLNYQTQVNAIMAQYNNAWRDFSESSKQVTTSTTQPAGGDVQMKAWRTPMGGLKYYQDPTQRTFRGRE